MTASAEVVRTPATVLSDRRLCSQTRVLPVRYHRHFVPASASWLNLIERWFAEITRKRIRRGTSRSVPDLIRAVEDHVTHHNRQAEPFIWTATAETILKKVRHCKEALETAP